MFAESLVALVSLLSLRAAQTPTTEGILLLNELPVAKYVAAQMPAAPTKNDDDSLGVEVSARGAVVMDVESGQILFQKEARTPYPVASLTKVITAMVVLDRQPNLEEEVTLLAQDDSHEGRSIFLTGERLTKGELLHALLVGSVNTAANALARVSGGREDFIKAMNVKAATLGLTQAHFVDPVGLGSRNQASAMDIAMALRAALQYPEIRETTELDALSIKSRISPNRTYEVKTTNLLLSSFLNKDPYRIVAAKTGSLPEAGFCLAQVTRHTGGDSIVAVVLGSENHFSRFQDMKALTAWTFDHYTWPK